MSNRSRLPLARALLFAILMAWAFPTVGRAAPITFASSLVQEVDENNTPIGAAACSSSTSTSGTPTSCSGTVNNVAGVSTLTYEVGAIAEHGTLKASGSSSIANPGPAGSGGPYGYNSIGTAFFRDVWTLTGGSGTGTLEFQFGVTGTYNFGEPNTSVFVGFSLQNLTLGTSASNNVFPNFNTSFTTPFTFDSPFEFIVSLVAGSGLSNLEQGGTDGQSSFMDLSSTAVLNAIIAKDANGNVVPFGLSTGSQAAYYQTLVPTTSDPAPIPEPASILLVGAGLAGAVARRRQKRQR